MVAAGSRDASTDRSADLRSRDRSLACRRRGLEGSHGRSFDDLPAEALEAFESSLVRSLEPEELDRALRSAISVLQRESEDGTQLASWSSPLSADDRSSLQAAVSSQQPGLRLSASAARTLAQLARAARQDPRALRSAISVLQRESEDAAELASAVEAQLQALATPT